MENKITIEDAYELTLKAVSQLETNDIKVTKVATGENRTHYPKADLQPEKWLSINFCTEDIEKRNSIFEAEKKLFDAGICFDTGSCLVGSAVDRDWEIDWSFHLMDD